MNDFQIFTPVGVEFLLRWFHILAGITWLGMLYYFNFVQTPFFKSCDGDVRSGMIRGLVPSALFWFRWGAMITFITGVLMITAKLHSHLPLDSTYMSLILVGSLMGTLMWANVWFVIWPAQKVVIRSAEQVAGGGEAIPEAAARGAKAGMASRTNTLFSIPTILFMGAASHFQSVGGQTGVDLKMFWIINIVLILLVELNALVGPAATQKPLTSVKGTLHMGFVLAIVLYLNAEFNLGG